ncbi:MAG: glycerophosphodiester phosphodiesterase family protein [Halioglobus sp.]|nr:glycerophosphodiester phosphodiesterase family protein [Halioglobus sp.]
MKIRHALAGLLTAVLVTGCSDGSDRTAEPTSLTVVPTAAPEGAPGEMSSLALRVTLTEPAATPVTVRYETVAGSGTATADQDYLSTAGEMRIPAGALDGFITVDVIGDAEEEPAETFNLRISTSDNAVPTATGITGTIANDDTSCDTPFSKDPNPWLVNGADPLNFAHRGGVTDFPENTLYAYAEAARAGADVLEMDVYQTSDNELVILHDLDVDRTTDGTGMVVDLSLAELRRLDAAYWFVPGAGTPHDRAPEEYVFRGIATGDKPPPPGYSAEDFRIPTLEEALARFPDHLINVELKPDLDGVGNYEVQMANLLQRYGRSTDIIAASFVDEAANNFKAVAPCVYTSVPLDQGTALVFGFLGTGEFPPVPEHITWQVPPDTSNIGQVDIELEVVTPEFVAASHAANLAVQVWAIDSCEDMLYMIDLGVDAIMTDRPLQLERILATPPAERNCD